MRATYVLMVAITLLFLGGCAQRSIWEHARNGNVDGVKQTLDTNPELVNAPHYDAIGTDFDNRWSPLRYAVEARQYEAAKVLLERGADPLQPAHSNYTPYEAARDDRRMEQMLREAIVNSGRALP